MGFTYTKNAAGEFVCPHCGVTKKNQNTMHYHLKKHDNNLPHECNYCHKKFLQAQTLANHIAARHETEERAALSCPCCDFKTQTRANRIIHFVRKHCQEELVNAYTVSEAGQYTCKACNKVSNSSTAFHYHVASCLTLKDEARAGHLAVLLA